MSNQPNSNARRKTVFDDWKQPLASTTEPINGGKYPAQVVIQQKSNGKIVLKINDGVYDPNNKSNHREVELNWSDRNALFEGILEATHDDTFKTRQMVIRKKQFIKAGGQSKISDNPITQAMFTIDRSKSGVISFTYRKGEYDAKIIFRGSNDTVLYMKNDAGEKVEDHGTMSRWAARAWIKWHQDPVNTMEREMWEPPAAPNGIRTDAQHTRHPGRTDDFGDSSSSYDDDVDF